MIIILLVLILKLWNINYIFYTFFLSVKVLQSLIECFGVIAGDKDNFLFYESNYHLFDIIININHILKDITFDECKDKQRISLSYDDLFLFHLQIYSYFVSLKTKKQLIYSRILSIR